MMRNNPEADGWVPLAQAAQLLASTPLNVLMQIKRGLLVGQEGAAGWQVEAQSLAALVHRRHEQGAPAVCASVCSKKHGCKSCG